MTPSDNILHLIAMLAADKNLGVRNAVNITIDALFLDIFHLPKFRGVWFGGFIGKTIKAVLRRKSYLSITVSGIINRDFVDGCWKNPVLTDFDFLLKRPLTAGH